MRYPHLDFLRGALMTIGVAYHTGLAVNTQDWMISTEQTSSLYDYIGDFIHSFRMEGFFLISGFFAALLLGRQSQGVFLKTRVMRLAIPLVATALTLNFAMNAQQDWSAEFWLGGNFLGHLWFLPNLIVYVAILSATYPLARRLCINLPYVPFVIGIALLDMCATALTWHLPAPPFGSFWFLIDFERLLPYSVYFFAGFYIYQHERLFEGLHSFKPNLALMALAVIGMWIWRDSDITIKHAAAGLWAMTFIAILFAATGTFIHRGQRWVRFISESSYTLYLFHQPILVVVGAYTLSLNPHLFFVSYTIGITLLCWWLHARLIAPSPLLSFLYNGRPMTARDRTDAVAQTN